MTDELKGCMDSTKELNKDGKLTVSDFQSIFCVKCRRKECVHAKGWQDQFYSRVSTQPERFFNPKLANPNDPKYSNLADFVNMVQEAMRIEIADKRNDWEIPEIPIIDGVIQPSDQTATAIVEEAVRNLSKSNGIILPFAEEKPSEVVVAPIVEKQQPETKPEAPAPISMPNQSFPKQGNTQMPPHGIILGGGDAIIESPQKPDPWALPKEKGAVVKPGAKIVLEDWK